MSTPSRPDDPEEPEDPDRQGEPRGSGEPPGPGEPGTPWWTGDDDVGGIGFARFFAYSGLLLAIASLGFAVAAPLEGDALRTVWITGFATVAMWIAFMAVPRYRREGVRISFAVPTTMAVGALTIAIMIYAFAAIALASAGVHVPAPAYWFGEVSVPHGITV